MTRRDMNRPYTKPWGSKLRSSPGFIISAVCIGLFTDSITACSIIPILPSALKTRAGVPEADVQLYVSAFMASFSITFLISCPIFGFLSDRLTTKKPPFVCGMVSMIVSLLLFMQTTSVVGMVMGRALQGISSAAILVIGTAMIKDTVTPDMSGKGMAFTTAASQLGLIMGPAVGGLIYDNISYEAVFILPASLLATDIVLRLLIIERPIAKPKSENAEAHLGNNSTDGSGERDSLLASNIDPGSQETIVTQTAEEQRSVHSSLKDKFPILHFFSSARMITALFVSTVDCIQWGALESTLPLFVMRTFHWTPSNAGALLLIGCTPGVLLSYIMGKWIDRSGSRIPAIGGVFVSGTCHFAQRLVHGDTVVDKVLLTTLFTSGNVAMLFVVIIMSVEVGAAAEQIDRSLEHTGGKTVGKAYALYMMIQSFGNFLGPIIGGAVIETTGWAGMTTLLASLCFIALPPIVLYTGERATSPGDRRAGT